MKSSTRSLCALTILATLLPWTPLAWAENSSETAAQAVLVEIPNARLPFEGVLVGGQPTEEDLQRASEAGYHTVVNLRSEEEMRSFDERAAVEALGMEYVSIPIAGASDLGVEAARKLAEVLAEPERSPVVVHCASGNRVGALFALKAFHVDGLGREEALALGRRTGMTRLEETVRELLRSAEAPPP